MNINGKYVSDEDYGFLICCSVRYCLGRQSYAPNWIQSIIRKHGVSDKTRGNILKDIEDAEQDDSLGAWIDKKGWLELKQELIEVNGIAKEDGRRVKETSKKKGAERQKS